MMQIISAITLRELPLVFRGTQYLRFVCLYDHCFIHYKGRQSTASLINIESITDLCYTSHVLVGHRYNGLALNSQDSEFNTLHNIYRHTWVQVYLIRYNSEMCSVIIRLTSVKIEMIKAYHLLGSDWTKRQVQINTNEIMHSQVLLLHQSPLLAKTLSPPLQHLTLLRMPGGNLY